jgi:O-methyltransferase involved in polyketide biosynthesis
VSDAGRIGPTAHYTGYVWARHGIGPPEFATGSGRVLHTAMRPLMQGLSLVGGPVPEDFLLARHRILDHLLAAAIEAGAVGTVVELGAGMSPRGHTFARRYGERVTYVETDVPEMAERKRRLLERHGGLGPSHQVRALDALAGSGEQSLPAVVADLDLERGSGSGLAIVAEGLLNYLPREGVEDLWRRCAALRGRVPGVRYLGDLHVRRGNDGTLARTFLAGLQTLVRGRVHLHYADAAEAERALLAAGFGAAVLHRVRAFADELPGLDRPGSDFVRIVDAEA